jgi:hypothetical protein
VVGEQGQEFFLAGAGEHRRQASEHIAEVDPRIVAVALAGGQACKTGRESSMRPDAAGAHGAPKDRSA